MGANTGNYSRNMFDIKKHYIQLRQQVTKPVMDADENDGQQMFYEAIKRAIDGVAGDGSPNNGFKISQIAVPVDNDFTIGAGDGTGLNLGMFFLKGHSAYLLGDTIQPLTYMRNVSTNPSETLINSDSEAICSKITGATYNSGTGKTTITDSAANYYWHATLSPLGELKDRYIRMDISDSTSAARVQILENTPDKIIVAGNQTAIAQVNKRYRIEMSTPTAARRDGVYLDVYLDEIDSVEDGNLNHNITTPVIQTIEAQRRLRLEQKLFVREDLDNADGRGEYTTFIDGDGNQHVVFKIAEINRTSGPWLITDASITDLRPSITPGGASDLPGTIKIWPVVTPPTGWLVADGSSQVVANFPNLFAIVGYTFGGSGANFNLPDAQGRAIFGYKSGDPTFGTLGAVGGSETKNLQHVHNNSGLQTTLNGAHNHGGVTGIAPNTGFFTAGPWPTLGSHDHPIPGEPNHQHDIPSTNNAGSTTQDVLNPFIVMPYIIKF